MTDMTHFTRFLTGAALLLTPPAFAQDAPAPAPVAAPAAAPVVTTDADPALWVVRDADTTIYLFGTVHLLRPGLTWFDEGVRTAFDASDELILEISEDPATQQVAAQQAIMASGLAQDGVALSARLSDAQRPNYIAAMERFHLPVAGFDRLEPWVPAMLLGVLPLAERGYDPAQGAEAQLTAAATAAGKRVSGLETIAEQIGFFDALPMPVQVNFLAATATGAISGEDQLSPLVDLWAAGNPDALATAMNAQMTEYPEIATPLLTDRNRRWAATLQARLAQPGTVFVAVGAGHLAGAQSVQAFLAERGVTATRVNY
jgi:uncharacterized protein